MHQGVRSGHSRLRKGARCGIHFTGDARSPISGISVKNLKIGRTELFLVGISNAENVSLNVDPVNACPHGEKANALQRLCNGSSYGKRLLS